MWAPPLLFFAYQFIMRLCPGLMMQDIMQKFQIDAGEFGVLSSLYYYGYAGMQIPVALLLDRFSARSVVALSAFICSLATLAFVLSDHWTVVLIARFLVGAGSAAGFLGVSKVITQWFPSKHYARMVGLSFTFGLMGALYGGRPVALLLEHTHWQSLFALIACVGVGISLLVFLVVRSPETTERRKPNEEQPLPQKLKAILKNPLVLALAFSNLLMVGPLEGFADVWGISYLMQSLHLTKADAAFIISFIFMGMLFGGPLLSFLAEKTKNEQRITSSCGVLMGFLFVFLFLNTEAFTFFLLCLMMFVVGVLCCYQVLVFSMGSKLVPPELMGITVAFLNCINMLGGSFFHSVIGKLMDLNWTGKFENGIRLYSHETYSSALMVIPVGCLLGGVLLLSLRKTSKPSQDGA